MTDQATEPKTERQDFDRKSLRTVTGPTADFDELAKDCVAFANATGGAFGIGIEDRDSHPPADQKIDPLLLEQLRKRVGELTVNVQVVPELRRDPNGGEFIHLRVPRSHSVASTSSGRYYVRVGDTCQPITGDDILRLVDERPATPWENMTSLGIRITAASREKVEKLTAGIRASDRVKGLVKEKSDNELFIHYGLAEGGTLTNLGVLLLGTASDRAKLGTAPIVQAIKYDERSDKIRKQVWDDHALSPFEIIEAVWQDVPDFRESYELPDGLFRTTIAAFEEVVVRELLVNALVHRPYTQRGDIFLNLHPDRLEVVNPGRLPLGVTPRNILHASRRRNEGLARVFHDLKLMEREGSGFDLMFERLLASGREAPKVREGTDSVHVTVPRAAIQPGVVRLLTQADQRFPLTQRERIALALLAQTEGLSAAELVARLDLSDPTALRSWVDRLLEWGLVAQAGRTRGTRYFVPPALVREAGLDHLTTLKRVQPHRLRALILEDLERFPDSSLASIRRRIGDEISVATLRREINRLIEDGRVTPLRERRWRLYRAAPSIKQGNDDVR